jgi:hypothetical protein
MPDRDPPTYPCRFLHDVEYTGGYFALAWAIDLPFPPWIALKEVEIDGLFGADDLPYHVRAVRYHVQDAVFDMQFSCTELETRHEALEEVDRLRALGWDLIAEHQDEDPSSSG